MFRPYLNGVHFTARGDHKATGYTNFVSEATGYTKCVSEALGTTGSVRQAATYTNSVNKATGSTKNASEASGFQAEVHAERPEQADLLAKGVKDRSNKDKTMIIPKHIIGGDSENRLSPDDLLQKLLHP